MGAVSWLLRRNVSQSLACSDQPAAAEPVPAPLSLVNFPLAAVDSKVPPLEIFSRFRHGLGGGLPLPTWPRPLPSQLDLAPRQDQMVGFGLVNLCSRSKGGPRCQACARLSAQGGGGGVGWKPAGGGGAPGPCSSPGPERQRRVLPPAHRPDPALLPPSHPGQVRSGRQEGLAGREQQFCRPWPGRREPGGPPAGEAVAQGTLCREPPSALASCPGQPVSPRGPSSPAPLACSPVSAPPGVLAAVNRSSQRVFAWEFLVAHGGLSLARCQACL